jgi:hypothetical protein
MIQIKPVIPHNITCDCGGRFVFSELLWQGLHICEKHICDSCNKVRIDSLPVNQSGIEQYSYYPGTGTVINPEGISVPDNWFNLKLKSIANPVHGNVEFDVEIFRKYDEVLILNTLDIIYGHSLLYLFNLQRIFRSEKNIGIIVIVQPMLKWLVPKNDIAEIWTVKLGFQDFKYYYPDLSYKINSELGRFNKVWLSRGHLIPTNENIDIEKFTGVKPYDFHKNPARPLITFIWREDPDRLWIRNIYILKGLKKLGLSRLLKPVQYLRVLLFFRVLKRKLGTQFIYSVAGLGKSGRFPSFISDDRVMSFTEESERQLCRVYSSSTLIIGVHGSSMLLPSAHSGMAISLMPSKRWGNYAEDILFTENDVRLAFFQRRIIPLNLSIYDICDIATDMVTGRDYFIRKFIHKDEL